jgi:hypothetical protein
MRFVLSSQTIPKIHSPSSDKNTFLVVNFDSKAPSFYEFKIVRNLKEKTYINNWVVIEAFKNISKPPGEEYASVIIKPAIFKQSTNQGLDKFKVRSFHKYLTSRKEIKSQTVKLQRNSSPKNSRKRESLSNRGDSARS